MKITNRNDRPTVELKAELGKTDMGLCAIVGSGLVGEYVAKQIRHSVPSVQIIGARDTRKWLSEIAPDAEYVSSLAFERYLNVLQRHGATEVIFAGEPYGAFRPKVDRQIISDEFDSGRALSQPHSDLKIIGDQLRAKGVTLKSILDYLPEMAPQPGLTAGAVEGYDPVRDLDAAKLSIAGKKKWRDIRQTCIVDEGSVVESEKVGRTDGLLQKFGSSEARKGAKFPVLCKIAIPPFEKIDVPTVGINTLRRCIENGVRAIVVEGGRSVLMQRDEVLNLANKESIGFYAR